MNPLALTLIVLAGTALLTLKLRSAMIALLVGCCYMTKGQGIELGPISLPVYRILLMLGVARIVIRKESPAGKVTLVDKILIYWAIWTFVASFFHDWSIGLTPIYSAGLIFDLLLFYFLIRIFIRDISDLESCLVALAWILLPVAALMAYESIAGRNFFSIFGSVPANTDFREGRFRAQGPFRQAILAGTVGAVNFPLFIALFRKRKLASLVGSVASVVMVLTSASSGPLLSAIAAMGALLLWRFRPLFPILQKSIVPGFFILWILMGRIPVYIVNYLNVVGGSTGWHRALLIDQTLKYTPEWFLFGTDRTRHWMPGQGAISAYHTDITNYYIGFAVNGGFLCMFLIILAYAKAFSSIGLGLKSDMYSRDQHFLLWALGASLFAHTLTGLSISYFDQSVLFIWLVIAASVSLGHAVSFEHERASSTLPGHFPRPSNKPSGRQTRQVGF